MIRVVFFASIREAIGQDEVALDARADTLTVVELIQSLMMRGDAFREALSAENMLVAVNQTMVERSTPLRDGDEVAFFPPVTGG